MSPECVQHPLPFPALGLPPGLLQGQERGLVASDLYLVTAAMDDWLSRREGTGDLIGCLLCITVTGSGSLLSQAWHSECLHLFELL